MKTKNLVVLALSALITCVAPLNCMEEKNEKKFNHAIKLSYNNTPLTWEQTEACLASKYLKTMILSEYDKQEIAIDEIIDNKSEKECFQNNILNILNIIPSIHLNLRAWSKERENLALISDPLKKINACNDITTKCTETSTRDISNIVQKYCYKDYQHDTIMDLIRCAHYIDSCVFNDLIQFAVNNNLISKKIIESPDYTIDSLKSIKTIYTPCCSIVNNIFPSIDTLDKLIERNITTSDEQQIINALKDKFYIHKEGNWRSANSEDPSIMRYHTMYFKPTTELSAIYDDVKEFPTSSLLEKIHLLKDITEKITLRDELIGEHNRNIKSYRDACFDDSLTLLIPVAEIGLAAFLKKYTPLGRSINWISIFLLVRSFSTWIGFQQNTLRTGNLPFSAILSPLYQILLLYELIKSCRKGFKPNHTKWDYVPIKKLKKEKLILENIKQTLEKILKHQYTLPLENTKSE